MPDIERVGSATWKGDLRSGEGHLRSGSGTLTNTAYSFATRFEQKPGTNPEELIAAAHAACYSMALAHTLSLQKHRPEKVETRATCKLSPQKEGGFKITEMRLAVTGRVPGIDEATFKRIAQEAEKGCPVSNALRGGLRIELEASLEQPAAG